MRRAIAWTALGGVFCLLVTAWIFQDLRACPDSCFVDYAVYHGAAGALETQDARLNSWILTWVQHSLVHEPSTLFDGNTFYPAKNGLTGSEHLLGMALQTWPFALLSGSAVAMHQGGLVLATVLTGWTTFVLTFFLTRVGGAALFAAFAAMLMPWRWMEFGHLQLLSAQWFPLIWLLFGQSLRGSLSRWGLVALAVTLGLQLLTSFYLAYFLTFSLAILALVFILARQVSRLGFLRTAVVCSIPYGLFVASAVPYLLREAVDGLAQWGVVFNSVPWARVLTALSPEIFLSAGGLQRDLHDYSIPGVVLALAIAAPLLLWRLPEDAAQRRALPYLYALLMLAVASMILCLGWTAEIGGAQVRMPGGWAARWVPGYENLRAPLRWAIVIGLALPPLAGIAVARLAEVFRRGPAPALLSALPLAVSLSLVVGASSEAVRVPVKEGWTTDQRRPYERLAELPEGTVLSLPWNPKGAGGPEWESRYALYSTLHWKRTLNGFTAYRPPVYAYLRDLARGLPDPRRIESLVRFGELRWIVLHSTLHNPDAERWSQLVAAGVLRLVYDEAPARIYEVVQREDSGHWRSSLREDNPRARTVTGLSREPLDSKSSGTLKVAMLNYYVFWGAYSMPLPAQLTIENNGERAWPGLDPDPEGLLHLRTVFKNPAGWVVATSLSPLHVDVPSHASVATRALIRGPARAGRYRVDCDLVQLIDGEAVPIDAKPVTLDLVARPFNPR